MNLLRTSSRSITCVSQAALLTRRPDCRLFSTEAPAVQQPDSAATFDPFHRSPPSGTLYASLYGITKYTSKSDVVNLLSDSNLSMDDIKHDYNLSYVPTAAHVRFPSKQDFDAGIRSITRRGRYRLEREIDSSKWDNIIPYDGKAVLLQKIPLNVLPADISRFLSGCPHDSPSIQIISRSMRISIVHFPSQTLAMNAFITKNRGICMNKNITMRVLY